LLQIAHRNLVNCHKCRVCGGLPLGAVGHAATRL